MTNESSLAPETGVEPKTTRAKSALAFILDLIQVAALTLVIIVPIRYFLVQPFYVEGKSMEPTFLQHEYLIIDELSYRLREPERGEVVVFRPPVDPDKYFIKRVIGLPGDTVEIVNDRVIIYNGQYPNGKSLEENYLEPVATGTERYSMRPVTLRENEYFLMGDNREVSADSRSFGPVQRSALIGRVWVRGYPIHRWSVFNEVPAYHF